MRIQCTGSFELPAPAATVLPLFTAEGERAWAPDWEPVYAESSAHEVGQVWTTAGPETTWVAVQTDDDCVRYARVATGLSAGIVTVSCREVADGTEVTTSYDLTALSAAGEQRLADFAASYGQMLEHWRIDTLAALG